MADNGLKFLAVGEGAEQRAIAVRERSGAAPGLLWLGGDKYGNEGTKGHARGERRRWAGRACVRFDYSGHGESSGAFADGTIGRWLEESVAVFEACCRGPQVVIGSSMGGWLALLLVRALRSRKQASAGSVAANIAGLV